MNEILDELLSITNSGFKSKHDDFIDTVSMLIKLRIIIPEKTLDLYNNNSLYNEYINYEEINSYDV